MKTDKKNRKKLIGLTGRARSGKDTAGKHLVMAHNFHRMAFADPLKDAMAATFGVAVEEFHCDALKDEVEPHWGLTRRVMLQQGADALRDMFGQDLFIKRWLHGLFQLLGHEHVVVTDVRSDAEALAIKQLGGRIVQVQRDEAGLAGTPSQHHTENGISAHLVDRVIPNNGDKQDVYALLDAYLNEESDAP